MGKHPNLRDQLILAGIDELKQYGFQAFSVRRIATQCGVSCAAPYKHFEDKQGFFRAIIGYIEDRWSERQQAVLSRCEGGTTREKLLAVSLEYIRFLAENSQFRAIIMLRHEDFHEKYGAFMGKLSKTTFELVSAYCAEVHMSDEVRVRKTFVVRSIIYGAALMFDNGELPYTQENVEMVSYCIDREFDVS
jgi:AcrR family transcriptional regulator